MQGPRRWHSDALEHTCDGNSVSSVPADRHRNAGGRLLLELTCEES